MVRSEDEWIIRDMLKVIYKEQDLLFQLTVNFLLGAPKIAPDALFVVKFMFGEDQVDYYKSSNSKYNLWFVRFINFARKNIYQALKLIPDLGYLTVNMRGMNLLNPRLVTIKKKAKPTAKPLTLDHKNQKTNHNLQKNEINDNQSHQVRAGKRFVLRNAKNLQTVDYTILIYLRFSRQMRWSQLRLTTLAIK